MQPQPRALDSSAICATDAAPQPAAPAEGRRSAHERQGDDLIGSPFSTLDNQGNVKLLRRNDGLAFVEVGSTRQQVSAPWGATAGGPTATWQMLAAETLGGVNKILFRNNTNHFLHTWTLNANWNWQSGSGLIDPSSSQGQVLLAQFQI
ncbi:MAG: hypothetical protein RLZZ117_1553 [Cyanobacteriota bacterium]